MNITNDMVERAARASWEHIGEHAWGAGWDDLPDDGDVKRLERGRARAVLEAALGGVASQEEVMSERQLANWETVFEQDYDGLMRFSHGRRVEDLQVEHGMTDIYTDEMNGIVEVTVWTVYRDNSTLDAWTHATEDYPWLTFVKPMTDEDDDE